MARGGRGGRRGRGGRGESSRKPRLCRELQALLDGAPKNWKGFDPTQPRVASRGDSGPAEYNQVPAGAQVGGREQKVAEMPPENDRPAQKPEPVDVKARDNGDGKLAVSDDCVDPSTIPLPPSRSASVSSRSTGVFLQAWVHSQR